MSIAIEVYGKAEDMICAGCEGHDCGGCSPGEKKATKALVDEFEALLASSELAAAYRVAFLESNPENLARNADVERLLGMAKLEPVICVGGKIAYLGGFSPQGLLDELRKKHQG